MENFDLQLKLFKFCGFFRFPSKRLKIALKFLMVWNYFSTLYFMFSAVFYAITVRDVLIIAECLAPFFTGVYSVVKGIMFHVYGDQFFGIVDEIRELNREWSKKKDQKEILVKANDLSFKVTLFLCSGCVSAGIYYIGRPLFNMFVSYWFYGDFSRELPFKTEHFYNDTISPAYELTFITQIGFAYFVVNLTGASGAIFCCYCLNIAAHFEILRDSVSDMDISDFVQYHRKMINMTTKLSQLYRPIIFTEFVLTTMILCVTGFQVIMVESYAIIMAAIFHAVAGLTDVAIYSYGGQKVLDSALSIADEAYKLDKNYVFIIMMSQKALKFDTGLFDASLDTLSIMLSRTMSFITLLKSFVS